ncbi:molybdenum ABC transporter ATP-binding protein [Rhodoferax sp.]|uniref:molybdenum ABC transporter ATP-binding protein n=1 Tax=Rhodoferax sp. TaxID=50421 RepID=UPI00263A2726|nr:molybdenum ABC transporter ATP-binding protein [Rhodoferax sp.]MDD4942039.1 molybdenum ABC transporter ATP-binding protein [Rhodoferax sp.]MDD5478539.1 molybdenum ABC transporter ATP-binding protein [Rhodoferax sp.]
MIEGNLTLQKGSFTLQTGAFSVPASGVTALFGRSGSGKSTLLRALAGLERNTQGQLHFKGECWQNDAWQLPATQRDIGFVFQDAALFPHLSVRGNLLFAWQRAPLAKRGKQGAAIASVAQRVGISELLDQPSSTLSGGQRQRVAMARALLSQPRLLCMDEPMSALDTPARVELLALIDALAQETQLPVLYITHAPLEVQRLAERVIFLADGRIQRIQSLTEALAQVDSPLFADEGPVSVLHGDLHARDGDGLTPFVHQTLRVRLSLPAHAQPSATRLRIKARDVGLATVQPQGLSILNQLPATITALHPDTGGRVTVVCQLADGQTLLAEITGYSCHTLALRVGMQVYALVKSVALMDAHSH